MAIRITPWAIDNNTHPAQDARLALAHSLGCDVASSFAGGVPASAGLVVDPGHGVTSAGALKVAQNGTPNMSVLVAAGGGLIRGTQSAVQGVYALTNDASTNLSISAANASNPRRDLVILQARDNAFDAGGINDGRLVVVAGTPAASPTDPSLASYPNALVLARVAVAANATSITDANIADLRSIAAPWANGRGRLGGATVTSQQTGIGTSAVDLTSLSATIAVIAGRRLKVTGSINLVQAASATVGILFLQRDGTQLNTAANGVVSTYGTTNVVTAEQSSLAAGSYTFKLRSSCNTGTINTGVDAQTPGLLMVEDIGGVLT